jgi:hypothetical protein
MCTLREEALVKYVFPRNQVNFVQKGVLFESALAASGIVVGDGHVAIPTHLQHLSILCP